MSSGSVRGRPGRRRICSVVLNRARSAWSRATVRSSSTSARTFGSISVVLSSPSIDGFVLFACSSHVRSGVLTVSYHLSSLDQSIHGDLGVTPRLIGCCLSLPRSTRSETFLSSRPVHQSPFSAKSPSRSIFASIWNISSFRGGGDREGPDLSIGSGGGVLSALSLCVLPVTLGLNVLNEALSDSCRP